jgi:hypothetical protein
MYPVQPRTSPKPVCRCNLPDKTPDLFQGPRSAPHAIAPTTPSSTRSAAPVVADACVLRTYVIIDAASSGVANRCSEEDGRAV